MRAFKKKRINSEERKLLFQDIKGILEKNPAVSFAYIFGSFVENEGFNDIDIALYADEEILGNMTATEFQLELGVKLEKELNICTIDCRALNPAPLSFRFSVITKGDLIFSRDEEKRVSFESMTRNLYFDFKPHSELYYNKAVLGR